MPSLIDVLRHPEQCKPSPEPLAVSLRPLVRFGIVVWAVVGVLVWILWFFGGRVPGTAVWTCAAGVVLGFIGLGMVHRRGWR
ncbi:DUF2530 domain-containing protein [Cellulomonas sp. WB94]|uniref:DUF2530 domain-containing protein n=1 Tax=Cellulomonas sp. WB94 TaxID=2173174 RepID=UPI000D564D62|nr:DUF2530 domain-containing protein [Cellulomonas sp. WB94]PVU83370.1 DUF2530 domain-containing protein [Cellulomonas sp. WB94]